MMDEQDEKVGDHSLKLQKKVPYNKYLPYAKSIELDPNEEFKEIKQMLCKAILCRDRRVGASFWLDRLSRFINIYGFHFTKQDHIFLVKTVYAAVINKKEEFWILSKFCHMLNLLLKKRYLLTPDDLTIPWEPLYELQKELNTRMTKLGMIVYPANANNIVKHTIRACVPYFPLEATKEIFDTFRPQLCPYDTSSTKAITALELFLPTMLPVDKSQYGFEIWLDELMAFWLKNINEPCWEGPLFSLLARLSMNNVGHVNFEKHLTMIFTCILRRLRLPVAYKKVACSPDKNLDTWAIAVFIVNNLGNGSSTQKHLNQLFKICETYLHPSNLGFWARTLKELMIKLAQYFTRRVYVERYQPDSWLNRTKDCDKLTEEDITQFVNCLLPAVHLCIFSKVGYIEAGYVLQQLSLFRPEIVIPPLIQQLYDAVDTVTEPHRLTASLHCVLNVSRSLAMGGVREQGGEKFYPEGPTHIIPLLFKTLPGIDPNDIAKCMTTFQFIGTFMVQMAIADCAHKASNNEELSEYDRQLCFQTGMLEDFVVQLLDKIFTLIESTSSVPMSQHDRDATGMSSEENLLENGIFTLLLAVISQTHSALFDVMLKKLVNYVKGRMLDTVVTGKLLSTVVRVFAKLQPDKTIGALMPQICRQLLAQTDFDQPEKQEKLDDETSFNLLLLSDLVVAKGSSVIPYVEDILQILSNTLVMDNTKGSKLGSSTLRTLLYVLTSTEYAESYTLPKAFDHNQTDYIHVQHWGESVDLKDHGIEWWEPTQRHCDTVSKIIDHFLPSELALLQGHVTGEAPITRLRMQRSLGIIEAIMFAGRFLPMWEQDAIPLIEASVPLNKHKYRVSSKAMSVSMRVNGTSVNIRLAIAQTIQEVVQFLLDNGSDDTKSFKSADTIYQHVIYYYGIHKSGSDVNYKSFQGTKQMTNTLQRKKHLRVSTVDRVRIQHGRRTVENAWTPFTETHRDIIVSLYKMSVSHYSEVRTTAQITLGRLFQRYPHSYKVVLPDVIAVLKSDPVSNHKAFKGALYVILGTKQRGLTVKRDWQTLLQLWPALLSAQYSEKPSIIKVYDLIMRSMLRLFDNFAIRFTESQPLIDTVRELAAKNNLCLNGLEENSEIVTAARSKLECKSVENLDLYNRLVESVSQLLLNKPLHFRRLQLGLHMCVAVIKGDLPFPASGVKAVTYHILNDNIFVRKICLMALPIILHNQKREHLRKTVDPFEYAHLHRPDIVGVASDAREDVRWMQYNPKSLHYTEEQWNNVPVLHKSWHGWYEWPSTIEVYAPPMEQPDLDRSYNQLNEGEKVIFNFFSSQDHVDRLIKFLSLEENKGVDCFDFIKLNLFKFLFRNFGDTFLDQFKGHLKRLAQDSQESYQRCAAEMISGMVRGSKHWPYAKAKHIQEIACDVFRVVKMKVMTETSYDWGLCLNHIARDRDPNRLTYLLEFLLKDPIVPVEESSFLCSSNVFFVQMFLEQQEWRVAECFHRVWDAIKPHLSSSYKSVRDSIGLLMYRMFVKDHVLCRDEESLLPRHSDFVDFVIPQLTSLMKESGTSTATTVLPVHANRSQMMEAKDIPLLKPEFADFAIPVAAGMQELENSRPDSPKCGPEMSAESQADASFNELMTLPTACETTSVEEKLKCLSMTNLGCEFLPCESDDRKAVFRLMDTVCAYLVSVGCYPRDTYRLLPHLCNLESMDSDPELQTRCVHTIASLGSAIISPNDVEFVLQIIEDVCRTGWWRARISALSVLQVTVFTNMFTIIEYGKVDQAWRIVRDAISDERVEVRQTAALVMSGFFHCNLVEPDHAMIKMYTKKLHKVRSKTQSSATQSNACTAKLLANRHTGALGLSAYISAFPYHVPDMMPDVLVTLAEHVNTSPPISNDIKQTLSNFKRTHHDNWDSHKRHFTSDQLSVLMDVLVSPSYYA